MGEARTQEVGGHTIEAITWDAWADWQCRHCRRVFEDLAQAEDNPCDIWSDEPSQYAASQVDDKVDE